jgi:hypothetical protein
MNVLIKIHDKYKMDGEGQPLGHGSNVTFWRSSGQLEVSLELALELEKEKKKRFQMVDRELAKKYVKDLKDPVKPSLPKKPKESVKKEDIREALVKDDTVVDVDEEDPGFEPIENVSLKLLKKMTKDQMNDWAAKRDYEVNPSKQKKGKMLKELVRQIECRTGMKIE